MHELTYITTIDHIFPMVPCYEEATMPNPAGRTATRTLLVPAEIKAVLCGSLPTNEYPNPRFSALIQNYIAGNYVSASLCGNPDKRLKPDFERLTDMDEAWAMCFRATKQNQWRLFGRFVQKNVFVGLALCRRSFLNGEKTYHAKAVEIFGHWGSINAFNSIVRSDFDFGLP